SAGMVAAMAAMSSCMRSPVAGTFSDDSPPSRLWQGQREAAMAERHDGHLGAVYDAKAPEEVAALYDRWAATYDAEMAEAGYRHPSVGLALLARHLPRGAGPVLDAGCGTGTLGHWLNILGLGPVEGLDISEGMLAAAARKGGYARLHRLA